MKALTIWQPWATLIMTGAKPHEWRTWPAPPWIRGKRIVIHAATRPMKRTDIEEAIDQVRDEWTDLIKEIALPILRCAHLGLPSGAALGTAIIGTPRRATEIFPDCPFADPDKWGWPLSDIQPFEPVVPCRGAQGFWEWRP